MVKGVQAGGKYSKKKKVASHDKWVVIKFMFRLHQSGDNAIRHGNTGALMSPHCIFMAVASLSLFPSHHEPMPGKYLHLKLKNSAYAAFFFFYLLCCSNYTVKVLHKIDCSDL